MLIDSFAATGLEELQRKGSDSALGQFLLIDGAFVPGIHRMIDNARKAILFEALPGCSGQARDLSPFIIPMNHDDTTPARVLRRCDGWPMVSRIETRENMDALSERLAAWCVVEADDQNFNFRFADTRRIPAIYATLNPAQRAQFAGPAMHWSYIARDGRKRELALEGCDGEIANNPTLDQRQFAALVDDSRADELLALLRYRGHEVYRHPSRSHALLVLALDVAAAVDLDDESLIGWCEWFWQEDQLPDYSTACALLDTWCTRST